MAGGHGLWTASSPVLCWVNGSEAMPSLNLASTRSISMTSPDPYLVGDPHTATHLRHPRTWVWLEDMDYGQQVVLSYVGSMAPKQCQASTSPPPGRYR